MSQSLRQMPVPFADIEVIKFMGETQMEPFYWIGCWNVEL
jgi:hypothetical protein